MITLSELSNTSRPVRKVQRVGRGPGSKRGKTCGRGSKGDKARCGYKQRYGYEGGQMALYRKSPVRGFPNGRFRSVHIAIDLSLIDSLYNDGETVNLQTLLEKGYGRRRVPGGLKILSSGKLQKKVSIEAHAYSAEALRKLEAQSVPCKTLPLNK